MRVFISCILLFLSNYCWTQSDESFKAKLSHCVSLGKSFSESGNIDSSIFYYAKALLLAHDLSDTSKIVELNIELGQIHENIGSYKLSMTSYFNALNFIGPLLFNFEQGKCYLGLSNLNFRTANNERALEHSIKAAKIFEKLNDTTNYIVASMLMGQVYVSLEQYNDALAICYDMLNLSDSIHDDKLLADNLSHIGVVYSFQGKYDKAMAFYKRALEINLKIENRRNIAINYANIGEIHMFKNELKDALYYLNKALLIANKQNYNSLIIFIHYTLGETYSKSTQNATAIAHFNKSLDLIKKSGEKRERPYLFSLLSKHYERNGNYLKSLFFYKKYSEERDSLSILAASYKVEELKLTYKIEQKEAALKSILLEKELQDKELEASKNLIQLQFIILILVVLGLLLLVIFTIFFIKGERKLKQANKTKDVLFSIIGHDLKGPMGTLLQLVEMLQDPEMPDKDELIDMLEQPIKTSYNLLDDLLAWSRSIKKNILHDPQNLNVAFFIEKVFDFEKKQANDKNIELSSSIPETITVYADNNHFYTILRNLISNAIKFTTAGGKISLSHLIVGKKVKISVKDTGLGIEPQNIKKVLDEQSFYTTYGTENEKGSGIGLVLCKEFIKINGGSLEVHSVVGKGSTFSFTLPSFN